MKSVVTCGSCNSILGASTALGMANVDFTALTASNFLLQAVVLTGARTDEGHIIESIAPAWCEIARVLCANPALMYQIDHRKWEELIAGTYKQAGFDEVILTPRSGDFGRDVIAIKHGYWTVRFIDQVKAFAPQRLVTADDVRALLGVLSADPRASKGIITTTSDFAPRIMQDDLLRPFIPTRLELINGKNLIHRLTELTRRNVA
jgi:restriction system protein